MAKKRMFSLGVLDTDAFLDMPLSTQALYFHLCLRADDDGFVGNPKRITSNIGASLDDLRVLLAKRFILAFDDGVIVIKHWRMHNAIKKDRYVETNYKEDLQMLKIKDNGSYTFISAPQIDCDTQSNEVISEHKWSTNGAQMSQTCSADKSRLDLDKSREDKNNNTYLQMKPEMKPILKPIEASFDAFWSAYPKKQGKQDALRAFKKALKKVDEGTLLKALDAWKSSEQWQKEKGRYIPLASTWLNGERWNDELEITSMETFSGKSDPLDRYKEMDTWKEL